MKGLKVLIVLGLTCISQVKSDPLSEKLETIKHSIPKELIPISDPKVTEDELISSISIFVRDELARIKPSYESALNDKSRQDNKDLLARYKNKIERIYIKLLNVVVVDDNGEKSLTISIFDILNYYMKVRYFSDLSRKLKDMAVTSETIRQFSSEFESNLTNTFSALIERIALTLFFGNYDAAEISEEQIELLSRILKVYNQMLKIFPFLYGRKDSNETDRENKIMVLHKQVASLIQNIEGDYKKGSQVNSLLINYIDSLENQYDNIDQIYAFRKDSGKENEGNEVERNQENLQENSDMRDNIV